VVRSKWLYSLLTFLTVFGPGLIVMEADNDAGAVSTYVQCGAQYGTKLLWVLLLLLPVTYFIQEMVVRLGIATGTGHAAMIYQRFGRWWGLFSLAAVLHAPLQLIILSVQVLAGIMLPSAIIFLQLLLNDKEVLGEEYVNQGWNNWVNWTIVIIVLFILSLILAAQVVAPNLFPQK